MNYFRIVGNDNYSAHEHVSPSFSAVLYGGAKHEPPVHNLHMGTVPNESGRVDFRVDAASPEPAKPRKRLNPQAVEQRETRGEPAALPSPPPQRRPREIGDLEGVYPLTETTAKRKKRKKALEIVNCPQAGDLADQVAVVDRAEIARLRGS